MTRRNIYLLVPQKGMDGFMKGVDPEKIKVVVGRGAAEKERERYERELNGGKTWNEELESRKGQPDAMSAMRNDVWTVHSDTDRSWSEMTSYSKWTKAQEEVDRLLNTESP